ncbi:hypothetical protein PG994_008127 [Apiospora phragmitis]|uniref:Phthalate transporter n=1 Tax=Apiospora phragmitis TaxID=2905665 RepID=A0ABR1UUJ4_9PEZI
MARDYSPQEHDGEKASVDYIADVAHSEHVVDSQDSWQNEFTPQEQRNIIKRIDRRLVTTVGVMYCVSLMDRTNLSAANIAGMDKDLKLVDDRYSIITLIFFVTYTIFQPPSTVIVRKIGPRVHLALITLLWGCVMIGMGFVQDWAQMAGLRVLLGVMEAGFFPSCVYLLSTWVGKRYSFFYILGCVASAFSGILAFGLMQMKGVAGLAGWRWIFIVEGLITCLLGLGGYWLLVDFPDSTRISWNFLGARERAWVVRRVNADRGDAETPKFDFRRFMAAGADLKIWAYAMIFFNTTTITYALAYFLPIILTVNLGFEVGTAQCLYHVRGPVIICNMVVCLIGLPIMGWHANPAVRYFGVFLVTAGANSNIPSAMAYQANNIRGQWKRAFCSATLVGLGGIGGIAGSLVFRKQDAATGYKPGLYACIACCLLTIILVCVVDTFFYFANKKADRGEKELEAHEDGYQPGFRYTL